jgi:hypothetical protein
MGHDDNRGNPDPASEISKDIHKPKGGLSARPIRPY